MAAETLFKPEGVIKQHFNSGRRHTAGSEAANVIDKTKKTYLSAHDEMHIFSLIRGIVLTCLARS